jgi:hypothetical protein
MTKLDEIKARDADPTSATGAWIDQLYIDRRFLLGEVERLREDLKEAVRQAEQGVFIDHKCPALYACASILADAESRAALKDSP